MKTFLLLITFICVCTWRAASQETMAIKAEFITGTGVQKGTFDNAYGIGTQVEIPLKKMKSVHVIAGFDAAINGIKEMPFVFVFSGSTTNTHVNYTNYLFGLSAGLKYILRDGKKWTPYTALSAGLLSYYTEMSIADTEDPLGCSPIERRPVFFSMVPAATAEAGLRIKTRQRRSGSVSYVEAGIGATAGTRGKYLQMSNQHEEEMNGDEYPVKFKQNSTGMIHEHGIGMMHRTTTSQMTVHVSFIFPL